MFASSMKEMNRLISKGMSSIYLKVTIEKIWKLWFCKFKFFFSKSDFGGLGAKLCVVFYYFNFKRNCDVLKTMHFLEQKIDFNKNETESIMENPTRRFRETSLVLQEKLRLSKHGIIFLKTKPSNIKTQLW